MNYCPKCGSPVEGNFCSNCGLRITPQTQQLPQRYMYPSTAPPVTRGPPISEAIGKSPMAKNGIILMTISIIALILFVGVPWIVVEREVNDGELGTFAFNYDLALIYGDEDEWGSDEYTSYYDDLYKDPIGQSFIGLILSIVLAILLVITGINSLSDRYSKEVFHGIGAIIGALLLVPGLMIIVSGMDFLGFDVLELHSNINSELTGSEVTSQTYFPAAYIIIIFGAIIFIMGFMFMKKELRWLQKSKFINTMQAKKQSQTQQPLPPQNSGGRFYG